MIIQNSANNVKFATPPEASIAYTSIFPRNRKLEFELSSADMGDTV